MGGILSLIRNDVFFLQERNRRKVVGERLKLVRIGTGMVEMASIIWRVVIGIAQLSYEQSPLMSLLLCAGESLCVSIPHPELVH